jgi:segregation and condensation protein A
VSYTIKIPQFEGPFDLLLFFLDRDEIDIYDIPISKITTDYLEYIRQLEILDIDVASEFIVVAATLMRIKARMLLPRREIDAEGNEIDPRHELVQKLLEYKAYKEVLGEFQHMEETQGKKVPRGFSATELAQIGESALEDAELESLTLFKLMRAFERAMERFEDEKKKKVIHSIIQFNFEVPDERKHLRSLLGGQKKCNFNAVFTSCENRIHAIVRFLAILEMLNQQRIKLVQGEGFNNFWIEEGPHLNDEEE